MHPDENGKVWSWVSERDPDRDTRTVRPAASRPVPSHYMDIHWEYEEVPGRHADALDAGLRDEARRAGRRRVDDRQHQPQLKVQMALIRDKIEQRRPRAPLRPGPRQLTPAERGSPMHQP